MNWFKDSRNHIEKEGDLSINSTCAVEILFSYTNRGPSIPINDIGLLNAGTKKLIRHARKTFPTGVYRDSALVTERRWVANTLPQMELTDALHYGSDILRKIIIDLDSVVEKSIDGMSPLPYLSIGSLSRRQYTKLDNEKSFTVTHTARESAPTQQNIDLAKSRYGLSEILSWQAASKSFSEAFVAFTETACKLFNADGSHITIGFLLDKNFRQMQILRPNFDDHIDKIIFWTQLADLLKLKPSIQSIVFISEYWHRSLKGFPQKRISDHKITGEGIHICGLDKTGTYLSKQFDVSEKNGKKIISGEVNIGNNFLPNFFVPIARAWNLDILVEEAVNRQ